MSTSLTENLALKSMSSKLFIPLQWQYAIFVPKSSVDRFLTELKYAGFPEHTILHDTRAHAETYYNVIVIDVLERHDLEISAAIAKARQGTSIKPVRVTVKHIEAWEVDDQFMESHRTLRR